MSLTINSNIAALQVQRSFGAATKRLTDNFTRLSSGLRINKAADDAAGLAIGSGLKADERILRQGERNVNDGVSLLDIADGTLTELSNIAFRLTELATQASNGTLGNAQMLALDKEAQALSQEYNRIARTAQFNGKKLFDSDFGSLQIATGVGNSSTTLITGGLGGGVGDGTFLSAAVNGHLSNVSGLVTADFNRDGTLDLATVEQNLLAFIQFGNGNGTFAYHPNSYTIGGNPQDLGVGDLNNDGNADLISVDSADAVLSVLFGNGNGSFRARISLSTGTSPSTVSLGDFNRDGYSDLVASDNGGTTLSVFLSNGNGSFRARTSLASFASPDATASEDINGDGADDVVVSSFTGNAFAVYLSNGNGTFRAAVSRPIGGAGAALTIADFNKDGRLDVAAANYNYQNQIFFGNGDGFFSGGSSYATDGVVFAKLGDFNGDGELDIAGTNFNDNSMSVLYGNGDGSFRAYSEFATGGVGSYSIVAADFNKDGVTDLASGNNTSSNVSVLMGRRLDGVAALQLFDLSTKFGAQMAMREFGDLVTRLGAQRATIGALQSRFVTAGRYTNTTVQEYREAAGRILDADVALEAGELTKNRIIQQASAAILAQANQQPAMALRLLS